MNNFNENVTIIGHKIKKKYFCYIVISKKNHCKYLNVNISVIYTLLNFQNIMVFFLNHL